MQQKYLLVAASIAVMWLAVLFVGIFGPDIQTESAGGDTTEVPVVSAVAFFAMLATAVVAWRGFRD